MTSPFVIQLPQSKYTQLEIALVDQGFTLAKGPYMLYSAKKEGISCTLYESGKLVIQGKKSAEWIDFFLEPLILEKIVRTLKSDWYKGFQPHLGSDEAGKGDLFGPLCVASVFAKEEHLEKFHLLGVQDSKNISDRHIREIAVGIWNLCPCKVRVVMPSQYNKLWAKFKNLNRLLAWLHAELIAELSTEQKEEKIAFALVDQFSTHSGIAERLKAAKIGVPLVERTKAESDPVVAAASILARASFLKGLKTCGDLLGHPLPKGSGAPAKATLEQLVRSNPSLDLTSFTKVHFRTVAQVKEGL